MTEALTNLIMNYLKLRSSPEHSPEEDHGEKDDVEVEFTQRKPLHISQLHAVDDSDQEVTIHDAERYRDDVLEEEQQLKRVHNLRNRQKFIVITFAGIGILFVAIGIRGSTKSAVYPNANPPITTSAPSAFEHVVSSAPSSHELYCFPLHEDRLRFTNMWSNYSVEVKASENLCGPGENRFSVNTVSVNSDSLILSYMKGDANWEASEVRVLIPHRTPFTYGNYSFSVKSVSVINNNDSSVVSNALPENLVLGLFTWDDTDSYEIHENWNHEVDIEISRWSNSSDADVQFLVQPVEAPSRYRFFSGEPLNPGGHVYEFTWNPGKIDWSTTAGGGHSHTYETKTSILNGVQDYIQCLPANMEVRMNLWNSHGAIAPTGLDDNQKVEVIIDNFKFTPSGFTSVPDGSYCSKDCMCEPSSSCDQGKCVAP